MKTTVAFTVTLAAGYTNLMTLLLSKGYQGLAQLTSLQIQPTTAEPLVVIPHSSANVAPVSPDGFKRVSTVFETEKQGKGDKIDAGLHWLYVANNSEITVYARGL